MRERKKGGKIEKTSRKRLLIPKILPALRGHDQTASLQKRGALIGGQDR